MVGLNEVKNMFWGITLYGGKRYSQTVEQPFHISMAALEPKNAEDRKGNKHVSVMILHEKAEFLVCTLDFDRLLQQPLDLNFTEGEEVTFYINGKGSVHLTGYLVDDAGPDDTLLDDEEVDLSEEDISGDESEEESDDDDAEVPVLAALDDSDEDEEDDWTPDRASKKRKAGIKSNSKKNKKVKKVEVVEENDDDEDDNDDDDNDDFMNDDAEVASSDEEGLDLDLPEVDMEGSGDESIDSTGSYEKPTKKKDEKSSKKKENKDTPAKKQSKTTEQKSQDAQTPTTESSKKKKKKRRKSKNKDNESPVAGVNQGKQQSNTSANQQKQTKTPQKKVVAGGTIVEELKPGHGPEAKSGKTVAVTYSGKLLQNGEVFDHNLKQKPFKFKLGKSEVIKGWDNGLVGLKVGGKRRITVPPSQGYGNKKLGPIPANSTLVFDLELKAVS